MHSVLLAAQSAHATVHHLHVLAGGGSDYTPNTAPVPAQLKNKVRVLLGFVSWTVTACCVAGVLFVAGKMAISHNRGEGGEHAAGLAWVGGACVLVGSAAAIVGAFV
jgi:hypothetical protein